MLAESKVWLTPAENFNDNREARPVVTPSKFSELKQVFASMLEDFIGSAEMRGIYMPLTNSRSDFKRHFNDVRKKSAEILSTAPTFIGAASFTTESIQSHDRMWREYASGGRGYCAEFQCNGRRAEDSPVWFKVHYGDTRRAIAEHEAFCMVYQSLGFQVYEKHRHLLIGLNQSLIACKMQKYKWEKEQRLVSFASPAGQYVHVPNYRVAKLQIGKNASERTRQKLFQTFDGTSVEIEEL